MLSEKQSRDGHERQLMEYLAKKVILLTQWGRVRRLRDDSYKDTRAGVIYFEGTRRVN